MRSVVIPLCFLLNFMFLAWKKKKKIQNKKKISNVPCGALAQDQNMNNSGMNFCEACDDLTSLPAIQMWCGWWPANRWHMSSHCPKMKCDRRIPWNKNKNNNNNYKTTTSIMDWWKKRWILPLIARSDNVQSRGIKSFIYPIFLKWFRLFGLDIQCSQRAIMNNYPPLLSDKCLTIELNAIHAFEICQINLRLKIIMDTCDLVIKRNATVYHWIVRIAANYHNI